MDLGGRGLHREGNVTWASILTYWSRQKHHSPWLPAVPLCPVVTFSSAQVSVMALRGVAKWKGLWAITVCSVLQQALLRVQALAYWCSRVIHLLKATSSVSAGFEGLSVALVSFLWHLSFTGCPRNSIQIFFCLVRSLAHMHTEKTLSSCCFTWLLSAHGYVPVGLGLSEI